MKPMDWELDWFMNIIGIIETILEKSFHRIRPGIESILEDLESWINNNLN